MQTENSYPPISKAARWTGYVMSAVPALMAVMGIVLTLTKPEVVQKGFSEMGYPASLATPLLIVEVACVAFYLVPCTAVLGAILLTGYLGGAVATHLRLGQSPILPIIVGILVWGGLFLRDRRIRALIPFRCNKS